jgi:raffinose synthase
MAAGLGGRVAVTKAFRAGLEKSVNKYFDGRLINCMANAMETYYCSPRSTLMRTSIDFWPTRPETHGQHLYCNAQVGVWFGEFMQPDWDMFQSGHPMGAFHAAGRAVSGGPVYCSDELDGHNFDLLRKLVLSDGTVLRADNVGRPTGLFVCRCHARPGAAESFQLQPRLRRHRHLQRQLPHQRRRPENAGWHRVVV